MGIFRKNKMNLASGDPIPFYHDGTYHIFYLTSPPNTIRYPERCCCTWQHIRSNDLVNWEELQPALIPGEQTDLDINGCWTGSVIFGEGKYHIFYTGYQINSQFPQKICHATSDDTITWVKDPQSPYVVPNTDFYENIDWRDSYVFFNDEDSCYWMLIAARRNFGPENRRGCIALYKSKDLKEFDHYGPIYEPFHTNCPECPEMYKLGDFWYLSYSRFSERGQTLYRYSESPYGPWRTPKFDGIDCRRFYAAKSLQDNQGRRIYFGWVHARENDSDSGWWQWGGDFAIPHEVRSTSTGDLDVLIPHEIKESFKRNIDFSYNKVLGNCEQNGVDEIIVNSLGTLSYGFFNTKEDKFLFECDINAADCGDYFGIALKMDDDLDCGYLLAFEVAGQRAYINRIPAPLDPFWADLSGKENYSAEVDGPRVCEKSFTFQNGDHINVKINISESILEIFIGNKIAFTYRVYGKAKHIIGVFAQDCEIKFQNISFKAENCFEKNQ